MSRLTPRSSMKNKCWSLYFLCLCVLLTVAVKSIRVCKFRDRAVAVSSENAGRPPNNSHGLARSVIAQADAEGRSATTDPDTGSVSTRPLSLAPAASTCTAEKPISTSSSKREVKPPNDPTSSTKTEQTCMLRALRGWTINRPISGFPFASLTDFHPEEVSLTMRKS